MIIWEMFFQLCRNRFLVWLLNDSSPAALRVLLVWRRLVHLQLGSSRSASLLVWRLREDGRCCSATQLKQQEWSGVE